MRLIVTRPEPDATRTARALIRLGHGAILSPMLDIVFDPRPKISDGAFQAVLATSTNAVRALVALKERGRLRGLPLLCVGDRTALHARRAGFADARSAGGDVSDLVGLAGRDLDPRRGPLLYVAGEAQTGDLAGRLGERGFSVETAIVYRAVASLRLAGVAATALAAGDVDGVLFYSRRTAAAFAEALDRADLVPLAASVACYCLSAAAAEPLRAIASGPILVAAHPDQLSLYALIERVAAGERASPP